MKYMTVVAAAALGAQSVFGLTINTPSSLVVCQPAKLDWSSDPGTPPYYLSIIPGGQPNVQAYKTFPEQNETNIVWKVDIAAGTEISIALKDSTGTTAYTDKIQIQSGPDTSCVNNSLVPATVSGAASGTSGAPAATAAGATSAAQSGTPSASSPSGSAHPSGTQAAVASSKASNAALAGGPQTVTSGLAAFVAIVGALFF